MEKGLRKKTFSFYWLAFIPFFLRHGWQAAFYHGYFQWADDFQWLNWFERVLKGEIPYGDFFLLYGPLLPYLFALPWKLIGANFFAFNFIRSVWMPIVSFLIATWFGHFIFKKTWQRLSFLIIFFSWQGGWFFFLQPWLMRSWFGILALIFAFLFLKKPNKFQGRLLGIASGLLILASSDQGVFVGAALIFGMPICLWLEEKRRLIGLFFKNFLAGFLMVSFPFFVFLLISGSLSPYVHYTFFDLPQNLNAYFGYPYPSKSFLWYLPFFVYGFVLVFLFRQFFMKKWSNLESRLLLIFLLGIFSLRIPLGRSDFGHLMIAYVPVVTFLLFFWTRMVKKLSRALFQSTSSWSIFQAWILLGTILLFLKFFLFYFQPSEVYLRRWQQIKQWDLIFNRLTGVYLEKNESENLNKTASFLKEKTKEGEPIYAHSSLGGFYHLVGRPNVVYYDAGWYLRSDEEQKEAIEKLEINRVCWAVRLSFDEFRHGSLIDEYLDKYFQDEKVFGQVRVLKRKEFKKEEPWFWQREAVATFSDFDRRALTGELIFISKPITPTRASVAEAELNLKYWPFLASFAKTELKVVINDSITVLSETPFVPKVAMEGREKIRFRFEGPVEIKKIKLILSSPGAFNPLPKKAEIKSVNLYL